MRGSRADYLWVAPTVLLVGLLAFVPLVLTLWISLRTRVPVFGVDEFVGLANYAHLLTNPRFLASLKVTAYFTFVSVAIELVLGLLLAHLLWKDFKGHAAIMGVTLIPWILPTSVMAKIWEWIYNAQFGVLNYLLTSAGLLDSPVAWLATPGAAIHAAILAEVWKTTPFMALLMLAGLRSIPGGLYKAAAVDGARWWQVFFYITLPELKPMILIALLFRSLDAFRVFDVIYVLTGGGPANTTETLSIYAYKVFFNTLQLGYGSAIGFSIFVCTALLSAGFIAMMGGKRGRLL